MTAKRFISMYNGQSDMIQYVDTLKEEPNKWSICNVSETLKKLNELHEEKEHLKTRFHEERELAMRLGSECDNLTIKNQKLELEIIRLETIIKTGDNNDCNRTS